MLFLDAYISPLEKEIPFQSQAGFFGRSHFPSPFLSPSSLTPSTISVCPSPSFFLPSYITTPPPPPSPTRLLRLPSSGAAARYFTPLMSQCLFPPPFCLVSLQKVECLAIGLGTPQSFSFLFFCQLVFSASSSSRSLHSFLLRYHAKNLETFQTNS